MRRAALRALLPMFVVAAIAGCSSHPATTGGSADASGGRADAAPVASATEVATLRTLISNRVRAISADADNVWIATNRGVSRLDRAASKWTHYTQEDGLAADDVHDIVADEDTVWMGTRAGLSLYDVQADTWRTIQEREGLGANRVNKIALDDQYVWVGTDYNGVSRYDRRTESWAVRNRGDGLSQDGVTALAVGRDSVWVGTFRGANRYDSATDSWNVYQQQDGLVEGATSAIGIADNLVWLGSERSGISVYDEVNRSFVQTYTKSDLLNSDDITAIVSDGSSIWIGAGNGGAQRYIRAVDSWIHYTTADGLASNHVSAIAIHGDEVWMGTRDNGVSMYDKVRNRWTHYAKADSPPQEDVVDIVEDASGAVWLATPRGLYRHDPSTDAWTRYGKKDGLPTEHITALQAHEDTLWVGTSRGLASARLRDGALTVCADGPTDRYVTGLAHAEGRLYVGSADGLVARDAGGLYHDVDGGGRVLSLTVGAGGMWVGADDGAHVVPAGGTAMEPVWPEGPAYDAVEAGGAVWLATDDGLVRRDVASGAASVVVGGPVRPTSLALSADGATVWVGSPAGLTSLDPTTGEVAAAPIVAEAVRSIALRTDGGLWVGTTNGLTGVDANAVAARHEAYVVRNPLVEDSSAHITYDGDYIWFSNWAKSVNGAIVRHDRRDGTWRRFTRETILGSTRVKAPTEVKRIVARDGRVWFATDHGVLRYDHASDAWRHYTTADGLHSNNVRTLAASDNVVWVASEFSTRVGRLDIATEEWSRVRLSRLIHPRNYIYDMAADGDGVWLTLSSSGVRRLTEDGAEVVHMKEDGLAQTGARWIEIEGDRVWVAHWNGRGNGALSMYDTRTKAWTVYSNGDVLENDFVSKIVVGDEYVWILYDSWQEGSVTGYNRVTGEWLTIRPRQEWGAQVTEAWEAGAYLWLAAAHGGVFRYHLASGTWAQFSERNGLPINVVGERGLNGDDRYAWIATPAGIARYEIATWVWTTFRSREQMTGSAVRAVAVDERYVWTGTNEGISRYDKLYGVWESVEWWQPISHVRALTVDPRYLWVGTGEGAYRYDKITDRWWNFRFWNGLPSDTVTAIAVDETDVWMGTTRGVGKFTRLSDDRNAWVAYTSAMDLTADELDREYSETLVYNDIWSIAVQGDEVWIGTRIGASQYHDRRDLWRTFTTANGLADNEVSAVAVDGENVYFAHNAGVSVYHTGQDAWETHSNSEGGSLASSRITSAVVGADAVWFGTFDAGVMRLDKATREWTRLSVADGLPHDNVLSLAVDGALLWIGTERGLARHDTGTGSFVAFTRYGDSEDARHMTVTTSPAAPSGAGDPIEGYNGPVVGNRQSRKYHFPGSPTAGLVKVSNRVQLGSVREAEESGYQRAGNFLTPDTD
jgi:ligand-binding sensor domain-containing protein